MTTKTLLATAAIAAAISFPAAADTLAGCDPGNDLASAKSTNCVPAWAGPEMAVAPAPVVVVPATPVIVAPASPAYAYVPADPLFVPTAGFVITSPVEPGVKGGSDR